MKELIKDRPLDILIISYYDIQEEGMQVTLKTPLYFAEQGHRVTFMVHSETTSRPSQLTELHPRLKIVRFKMPFRWMNKVHYVRRVRQLLLFGFLVFIRAARIYRRGRKPDLVYAAEADAVLIGSFLKYIYRVPLVTRFYGVSRITEAFDFESKRLKPIGLRNRFSVWAMTRDADMAVITDDGSRGLEIIHKLNPRIQNVKFWRNGVNKPVSSSQEIRRIRRIWNIPEDAFALLTLCRLDPWKGVDRAVKALKHLSVAGLTNVHLIIIGDGEELEPLQDLARREKIFDRTHFVGAVQNKDIGSYLALSDVFLSLYRYSNVGNPLLEALMTGCCVVTLATAATEEVVRDGINGRLLPNNPDEAELVKKLSEAIQALYRNPKLRKALSNGALDYAAKSLWTWESRLQAELEALCNLVQPQGL